MPINLTQVRTWSKSSDNDGDVFNNEFARLYANVASMRTGLAKSADYTILGTDNAGLLRVSNGNAAVTGKAFNTANPVSVASVGHGLVTGDSIIVQSSSDETEVGNIHYYVTRTNDDAFTLDGVDNSAGGGGTLNYIKDVTITMPSAASQTDQIYSIMKADAASTGAVLVTDGSTDYILLGQYDVTVLGSNGTSWIELSPGRRGSIVPANGIYQVRAEYVLHGTDVINATTRINAVGSGAYEDVVIPELPDDTLAIHMQIVVLTDNGVGATEVAAGIRFVADDDANYQRKSIIAVPASIAGTWYLVLGQDCWIPTKGQTNVLRAKKENADTVIQNCLILGYKTGY